MGIDDYSRSGKRSGSALESMAEHLSLLVQDGMRSGVAHNEIQGASLTRRLAARSYLHAET